MKKLFIIIFLITVQLYGEDYINVLLNSGTQQEKIDDIAKITFNQENDINFNRKNGSISSSAIDDVQIITFSVDGVQNSSPTGGNNKITIDEDQNYTFQPGDFIFNDPDGDPFSGIKIFSIGNQGDLKYNGNKVSINDKITDLSNLTFYPEPDSNGTSYSDFKFKVFDGTDYSFEDYKITIDINPVNDPPTSGNDSITTNEDQNYTFKMEDFNYNDAEDEPFSGIKITSLETSGQLKYNNIDISMNDQIGDLSKLIFIPEPDSNGSPYAEFEFKVYDGTAYSSSIYTMTINVNQINDLPTSGNDKIFLNEDQNYSFQTDDFTFNDVDGDNLFGIKIMSIPKKGELRINGNQVESSDLCSDLSKLVYTPLSNESRPDYSTFEFKVYDGNNFSSSIYTMTIDVNPVDDPPEINEEISDVIAEEDGGNREIDLSYTFTDIDNHDTNIKISINNNDNTYLVKPSIQNNILTLDFEPDQYGTAIITLKALSNNKFVTAEFKVQVKPVDDPPQVVNPISDLIVNEDTINTYLGLNNIFKDVDSDEQNIRKLITRNSTKLLVVASVSGDTLVLDYQKDQNGVSTIVIKGEVDNKCAYDTFTVRVKPVDDPPIVLDSIDNIIVNEEAPDTTINLSNLFTDVDNDDAQIVKSVEIKDDRPPFSASLKDNNFLHLDFQYNQHGSAKISVKGSSNKKSVTYEFEVQVNSIDDPIMIMEPIPDVVIDEDFEPYIIDLSRVFTDTDNNDDKIKIAVNNIDNKSLLRPEIEDDILVLFSQKNQNGSTEITLEATSNGSLIEEEFSVKVNPINDKPVSRDTTIVIKEDENYSFNHADIPFFDIDNDSLAGIKILQTTQRGKLIYNAKEINSNKICSNLGNLNYLPGKDECGSPYSNLVFKVKDSENAFSDSGYTLTFNVIDINDPPKITQKIPDTTIRENSQINWSYQSFDPDGDSLFYGLKSLILLPDGDNIAEHARGLLLDSLSGVFSWTIGYDWAGKYEIITYVNDGQISAYDTSIITIKNVNRPPEFTKLLPDTNINNETEFIFTYQAHDPDDDELSFYLQDTIAGIILSNIGELSWLLPPQPKERYKIHINVTDNIDTITTSAIVRVEDVVSVSRIGLGIPDNYSLGHNYPNPFNPTTTIKFGLPERTRVNISIYTINGSLIETILDSHKNAGYHQIIWNADNISTGVYIYRMQTSNFTDIKKCILMK